MVPAGRMAVAAPRSQTRTVDGEQARRCQATRNRANRLAARTAAAASATTRKRPGYSVVATMSARTMTATAGTVEPAPLMGISTKEAACARSLKTSASHVCARRVSRFAMRNAAKRQSPTSPPTPLSPPESTTQRFGIICSASSGAPARAVCHGRKPTGQKAGANAPRTGNALRFIAAQTNLLVVSGVVGDRHC